MFLSLFTHHGTHAATSTEAIVHKTALSLVLRHVLGQQLVTTQDEAVDGWARRLAALAQVVKLSSLNYYY